MLTAYILQTAGPIEQQTADELAATGQVIDWLEGVPSLEPLELPSQSEVFRRLHWHRMLQSLKSTRGKHYRGRGKTLLMLSRYVQGESSAPLMLWGVGGVGKSATLADFVLKKLIEKDQPRTPFAYLDFERAAIVPSDTIGILDEIVRQLKYQFEEAISLGEVVQGSLRDLKERYRSEDLTLDSRPITDCMVDLARLVSGVQADSEPAFALLLDTFEEVQRRSREHVNHLLMLIKAMQRNFHSVKVRTILAGRAEILVPTVRNEQLGHLDKRAAISCLKSLKIQADLASEVYSVVGGNPLILRLAANLLGRSKDERPRDWSLEDASVQAGLRDQLVQGYLFDRILEHLDDKEVQRLAHPGLILRKVTPELIQEVLAKPCGFETLEEDRARKLYDRLAAEAFLVSVEDEGKVLRHRPELRREMLHLMKSVDEKKANEIHLGAIKYYSRPDGPPDRLEELYHRLAIGQPASEIDKRWDAGLQDQLLDAIDEYPQSSQEYLAAKHTGGAEASGVDWATAETANWELRTRLRVLQLMELGDYSQALEHLEIRQDRTPNSPLYALHVRLLMEFERWQDAYKLVQDCIFKVSNADNTTMLLDLFLLSCEIELHLQQRSEDTTYSLRRAIELAERSGATVVQQAKIVKWRIWLKDSSGDSADQANVKQILPDVIDQPTDSSLERDEQHLLARELAAEIVSVAPRLVAEVVDRMGLGSRPAHLNDLASAIARWDESISGREQSELADRIDLSLPQHSAAGWRMFLHRGDVHRRDGAIARLLQQSDTPDFFFSMLAAVLSPARFTPPQLLDKTTAELSFSTPSHPSPKVGSELRLSNEHLGRIHAALVAAFTRSDFDRFLYWLDSGLSKSVDSGSFSSYVYRVIEWAERRGRLLELLWAASKDRPQDEKLRRLALELSQRFRDRWTVRGASTDQNRLVSYLKSISPGGSRRSRPANRGTSRRRDAGG